MGSGIETVMNAKIAGVHQPLAQLADIEEEYIDANDNIRYKVHVKQPYINADGVEIKLSQDDLNKIQELADYYTTVAGQDFTVRKINQAETGVEPPKHIEVSSSTTKAVTVKIL